MAPSVRHQDASTHGAFPAAYRRGQTITIRGFYFLSDGEKEQAACCTVHDALGLE
jgi:hypothetical protein